MNLDSASLGFILFGLLAAVLSNLGRSPAWRSAVLLLSSIVFLALLARSPIVLLPFAGFLLMGYGALVLFERGWSKSMAWSILAVVFVYIWLKKYTFLPQGIFLHFPYFTLGLSYIFFRVLHLLIEAGDGREKRHLGIGAYLLYTLNFTTLLSGPIQRYDEFARDQFAGQPIALGPEVIGLQLERIVRGFFKVNVLAAVLYTLEQDALAQMSPLFPLSLRFHAAFKLAVIYPFFLYTNFSGYIDIVIALARLMRVRLPENFNRPFSAASFLDFWHRWHITLSQWLRAYVYNLLFIALVRRITSSKWKPVAGVFCFFVTFFLVGVWHGRTSEFLFFGVLQGGGVAVNKAWQLYLANVMGHKGYRGLAQNPVYVAFGRGLTFTWFAFTLVWFWSSWKQIGQVFSDLSVAQWLGVWLAVALFMTAVLAFWEWLRAAVLSIKTSDGPILTSRYARVICACALGLVSLIMTVLLNQPAPDIVYKAF
jgi:D-alanyl-lipoteichoic acid acyltransferase DltB (MBOAT superfamily)